MTPRPPTVFAGERYGRLTVIRHAGMHRGRDRTYLCRCECGNTTTVIGYCLRSGNTKSCGCLKAETSANTMRTHGHTAIDGKKSPTYETWRGMIHRCKPSSATREYYAERGITVCEQWRGRTGFATFLNDMGERPKGLTLDRIDPDGDYEPGNCRWATYPEQSLNKRPRARLNEIARLTNIVEEQQAELTRLRAAR